MNYESRIKNQGKNILILAGLILIFTLAGGYTFHKFVTAQDATQGLEVSPPSQEVTIDPGKTVKIKAKIRNKSNSTLPIKVHVEDFTAKGDEGQIELNANSPYSVASWTKITPNSFNLEPGGVQEVQATITVPSGAAGGRFGSFVFSTQSDKPQNNAATVTQEIASLFLVRVTGPVDEKLTIVSFTAPPFLESDPINFDIKFSNTGNVHVKTYGLINVTDMFGRKVDDIVVSGVNIFPGSNRLVKSQLNKKFLFGNYKATALMYYGAVQNQSLSADTSFFVFPLRFAGLVATVLIILFLLRKRLKKALKALFG